MKVGDKEKVCCHILFNPLLVGCLSKPRKGLKMQCNAVNSVQYVNKHAFTTFHYFFKVITLLTANEISSLKHSVYASISTYIEFETTYIRSLIV